MEVDLRKIISRHLKDIVGVREKYVATLLIRGHKLMFPFLKGGQSLIVVALNPASLIEAYWLPSALSPVFMKQAILNHLKLKLADSADNFPSVEIICEYPATPSSISWLIPLSSCFCFIGSAFSIYLNISGEKEGRPLKCKSSPEVSVSPILKLLRCPVCPRCRPGRPRPRYSSSAP